MDIINVTPSRATVDAALVGPVAYGQVITVEPADGAMLVASGHFAEATKANKAETSAALAAAEAPQSTTETTTEESA